MAEDLEMDLNLLLALGALLEDRNLTRASERIGMSQPAMSAALVRLRQHFGDDLLEREGRGYHRTVLGEQLVPAVREALGHLESTMQRSPHFDPAETDREFSIAASDYTVSVLARPLLRMVKQAAPRIRLNLHPLIWLLLGMLRANRPWRLALRLVRVLAVAFAAGVFALATSDIWRLAHYLGPLRLVAIALGSVATIIVTILIGTGLWERSPHPGAREQVALFNIVTAATVGLGVAALYLALFIALLAAALLLVPGDLLGLVLGHPAGVGDQVSLAWLATSIATLGGALGAALESGESVREAAYTYQMDTRVDAGHR